MNGLVLLLSTTLAAVAAEPQTIHLSSLAPRLANQGWGALSFDHGADGKPLQIGDRRFEHGVSTHARSDLVYLVGGQYRTFRAWVGVDAATSKSEAATAIFEVYADGRKLFESGVMKVDTPARRVEVDVAGVNVLRLIVRYDGTYADRADWAEAELVADEARSGTARSAPGPAADAPVEEIRSGDLTFWIRDGSLEGFAPAKGKRIDLRGSGGMGPYVTSDSHARAEQHGRFRTADGGLSWDWEVESSSSKPWTAPVDTVFRWPDTASAEVWLPWGHGWEWQDPLEPRPFEDRTYDYGAFFNRENGLSLPMATILDRKAGVGVTFIQSPDDVLLDMQISTTSKGEIRFSRAFNRFGGEPHVVSFHMDVVVHEPYVRAALNAIVERYPQCFDPPNPLADEIGGGAAYSGWEGEIDAQKLKAMGFTFNWKASLDFPYMGLFLPPVSDDARWNRFAGGGEGVYGPADEGRYGQTSFRQMNEYSASMRRDGFYVLNYFNVTEFGGTIVDPPPPRKAVNESDLWKDPDDLLHGPLKNAILRTPSPIWTWGKALIVDCGDPPYRAFLLEQARRHLEKLPDSSGICIDRMDWLTRYNPNADDGMSWIDGPSRHLRRSWMALLEELGPLMHRAGKVIFANDMDRRLELMKQIDGFYDEHGDYPFNLNTSAFLALRKPLVSWTRGDESLKPDPDLYFQRNLYLGSFPTVPYPGNDHTVVPDEWNERQYLDYGPLFDQLRGRKWLLKPGVARVDGGAAKVNVFETKAGTVVFVGLAGGLDRVRLTLHGLGKEARVLYPGESSEAVLEATATDGDAEAEFDVPLRRGCAMLILGR
jgi:NPCBM/NEW2 domain